MHHRDVLKDLSAVFVCQAEGRVNAADVSQPTLDSKWSEREREREPSSPHRSAAEQHRLFLKLSAARHIAQLNANSISNTLK